MELDGKEDLSGDRLFPLEGGLELEVLHPGDGGRVGAHPCEVRNHADPAHADTDITAASMSIRLLNDSSFPCSCEKCS